MTVTCTIIFENNPKKVFYSGDLICGHVRLVLTERKKVRGVQIKFKGEANTAWSETVREEQGYGDDRKYVDVVKHYQGHETYLNSKIFLVGGSNDEMHLEPGEYIYNFSYRLPMEIPSSFSGTYGSISYKTSVVLVIPWWMDDKFRQTITIIKRVDLNDNLLLHRPVVVEKEHHFYPCLLCCFPSDPLKITAEIPVGGYVPGQTIKLTLTAENESDRQIPIFKTQLEKSITYYAEGEIKSEEFVTKGEQSTRGVESNQKRVLHLNIRVPSYPATDSTACSIIKIRYSLVIKAESGSVCNKPKIEIPITIGTHAINNFDDSLESGPTPSNSVVTVQPSAPRRDDVFNGNGASAPPYPADELPSYTMATIEKVPLCKEPRK